MSLRSKYKKNRVKVADLKAQTDAEDSMISSGGGREDYLEIKEGKSNKIRLFPGHDGTPFSVMRKRYWMEVTNDEGEVKKRPVWDSIIHGGTKMDLVQEYVAFCAKNVKDQKKLEVINDWKKGLKAQLDWVAYALGITASERNFGIFNYKKQVRDQMNKLMYTEEDDEPIEVDPFTDVDDGTPILVTYNSKPNKKKGEINYGVTLSKKGADPITDEELDVFEAAKPLSEIYRNNYNLKEFEKALEGLEYFDELHEIDIFSDDRWMEVVEKVKAQYTSDDEDEDDEDEKPAKRRSKKDEKPAKKSKKAVVEDDDEDDDEEEDEKPVKKASKKKPKPEPEDDDEDEDDEEEDEKPVKKSKAKAKKVVEEDDEDEDEEEDEKPAKKAVKSKKKSKPEPEDDDEDDDDEDEEEKPRKKMSVDDVRKRLKNRK